MHVVFADRIRFLDFVSYTKFEKAIERINFTKENNTTNSGCTYARIFGNNFIGSLRAEHKLRMYV